MTQIRQILEMNAFDIRKGGAGPVGRRLANLGAASVLFYREPIEMVSASGAWMVAKDGTRYLDFYNNVPSVGHSHPTVVAAVTQQIGTLNTNMRYLVEVVDRYLEALKAKLPADLSNVVLTCSGSEANDLAMRVARRATGGTGFIVTETAYHGNTALVTDASPSALKRGSLPDFVVTVPAPGSAAYGADIAGGFARAVEAAMAELKRRGLKPAALLADSIFSSDGIFADPPGFLLPAVQAVQAAGGLYIADEVQPGFARSGTAFWGFERHGIAPDIVTMGKPMGNGFPMAGMAARPDHLAAFCQDVGYFNTFGGNPVAAAAGLAVLQVIEEEGLQENARVVGAHLKAGLEEVAANAPQVAEVRGSGLFIGVDLCAPDAPERPDAEVTVKVIDAMRNAGVLIGAAGRYGATLKVRPPLCLTRAEADRFIEAFAGAVAL
ncbi:aspartate aminotransferase family protein [Salipiger sp. P9]|uniref:aspartate aminotransferase family protein n=1 Tax=Salipiger pentaromativorans TaxID=2943193 RepID=UPI0021588F05|nr:aspartate aminotransferase family protein [Salipiger pentaromativorans]MCR8546351.1 aspartate aminotransferase family protein [Salipiger pentaromativorans]